MFKLNLTSSGSSDPFHHLDAPQWVQKQIEWADKTPAAGEALISVLKQRYDRPIVGVEIGVCLGYTTEKLVKEVNFEKYFAVDSYHSYVDWNGGDLNADRQSLIKQHAVNKLSKYNNVEFKFKSSEEFSAEVEDNSLDFIFIDGDHSYEGVLKDLNLWFKKVKPFGILSGHDASNKGVTEALKEFFKDDLDRQVTALANDAWYTLK